MEASHSDALCTFINNGQDILSHSTPNTHTQHLVGEVHSRDMRSYLRTSMACENGENFEHTKRPATKRDKLQPSSL